MTKKHKNFESGFMRWNPDNSQVSLFKDDKKTKIGDTFIPGGPKNGSDYTIGAASCHLNDDFVSSAPPVTKPISRGRVLHQPSKPLHLPPKKLETAPQAPITSSVLDNSSKSPSSTPPSATPIASSVRKRPYAQLPFRAPARSEPVAEVIPDEEPHFEPYSPPSRVQSFSNPAPSPSIQSASTHTTSSNNSSFYPMMDWNMFQSSSEHQIVEEAAFQPASAVPADQLFGSEYYPAAVDPRVPPSQSTQQASSFPTKTPSAPSTSDDPFASHMRSQEAVADSRVKTFSTRGTAVDLSATASLKAPPPLPPRADGQIVSAASMAKLPSTSASPFSSSISKSSSTASSNLPPPSPRASPSSQAKNSFVSRTQTTNSTSNSNPSSSFTKATAPAPATSNNSKFKSPAAFNPHDEILGFGNKSLVFPSRATIAHLPKTPRRSAAISASFSSINDYKQQFTEAMFEEINHGLLPIASKFHAAYTKHASGTRSPSDSAKNSISSSFRSVYFNCELICYKIRPQGSKKRNRAGEDAAPSVSAQMPPVFLKLPESFQSRDSGMSFLKDDLWIISTCADFEPQNGSENLFFARSAMHGKPPRIMEIKPIFDGAFKSLAKTFPKLDGEMSVHAIHAMSISGDLAMIEAIHELSVPAMPLLPYIVNSHASLSQKPVLRSSLPSSIIHETLQNYLESYKLNEDQFSVFKRAALWFDGRFQKSGTTSPFVLVHGVFGSGKSFMLVALIMFICELFEKMDERMPAVDDETAKVEKFRILVSAATNTAVDRILVSLLEEGFTDFVRVGSLKRINSRILPYSIHREKRSGGSKNNDFEEASAHSTHDGAKGRGAKSNDAVDRIALRDLEELLRSRNLTSVERALIEQQKIEIESGSFERKLDLVESASVVGATCIATTFPILKNAKFDIVILDECSQMPEPLSLLPTSRFGSVGFVLVGDPLQLPPQLRTKPKNDESDTDGLGLALFSRLTQLGTGSEPILLRTQYRLHPLLSSLPNELFYHKKLINGTNSISHAPLHSALPTILFIDNENSVERVAGGGSIENSMEANIVIAMLKKLVSDFNVEGDRIGVICLYKAQANLINKLLENQAASGADFSDELSSVQISTVDAFQGAEKDIILLSTCRTEKEGNSFSYGAGGFLESPFRLNVSITRGKRHMFIIGSAPLLLSSSKWKVVLNTAKGCGPRSYVSGQSILTGEYFSH